MELDAIMAAIHSQNTVLNTNTRKKLENDIVDVFTVILGESSALYRRRMRTI
jgi:hypothetical protein